MSLTLQTHLQNHDNNDEEEIREIHALTPLPPPPAARSRWETNSHHRSSSLSTYSETASSENFTSMSREFNALVLAGSSIENNANTNSPSTGIGNNSNNQLSRIGENDVPTEETNHLAIVPDNSPLLDLIPEQRRTESVTGTSAAASASASASASVGGGVAGGEVSVLRVKKEEVDSKILAWQNAKVAKINNRFKREDAIINGWESEQVQKATSWMKKVERKLEEKRARALEKMQNDVAKARQKAEERRASVEAKRGTKVARVLELANLMKAVGRAPGKRSFF